MRHRPFGEAQIRKEPGDRLSAIEAVCMILRPDFMKGGVSSSDKLKLARERTENDTNQRASLRPAATTRPHSQ